MSYQRKQKDKHKLRKLFNETNNSSFAGAYFSENKNRLIRYSVNNTWHKTHARRVTRRRLKRDPYFRHNSYKKIYDYIWEVW